MGKLFTNKIPRNDIEIADRAKDIEKKMRSIDWLYMLRVYAGILAVVCFSIIVLILSVRIALS